MFAEKKSSLTPEEELWTELETNEHQPGSPKGAQAENNNDNLPRPEKTNSNDSQQEISACFEAAIIFLLRGS
jgi:hypothetical protein